MAVIIDKKTRDKLKGEIREIMVNQAAINKTIYYQEICNKCRSAKLNPNDQLLNDILGEISYESYSDGKGMLSVFAVNKKGGSPGDGFFSYAKQLGCSIGSREKFVKDQMDFVHNQYRDPNVLKF